MDSAKLSSVIFLQIQDGDIQDGGIQKDVLLLSYIHAPLCPRSYIRPQYLKATDNFRFTTQQPVRIHCPDGRRLPNVYEIATIGDWYTDRWHYNRIGILGIGYDEHFVTRVMTDKSSISSPPSCTENS